MASVMSKPLGCSIVLSDCNHFWSVRDQDDFQKNEPLLRSTEESLF